MRESKRELDAPDRCTCEWRPFLSSRADARSVATPLVVYILRVNPREDLAVVRRLSRDVTSRK